jgi:hypothetical protein
MRAVASERSAHAMPSSIDMLSRPPSCTACWFRLTSALADSTNFVFQSADEKGSNRPHAGLIRPGGRRRLNNAREPAAACVFSLDTTTPFKFKKSACIGRMPCASLAPPPAVPRTAPAPERPWWHCRALQPLTPSWAAPVTSAVYCDSDQSDGAISALNVRLQMVAIGLESLFGQYCRVTRTW